MGGPDRGQSLEVALIKRAIEGVIRLQNCLFVGGHSSASRSSIPRVVYQLA